MSNTTNNRLIVYGAGGHGQVIAAAAELAGLTVLGFVDDAIPAGQAVSRWRTVDGLNAINQPGVAVIIGIGDNTHRKQLQQKLETAGIELATIIHPSAIISIDATIGKGVFIGPGTIVHHEAALSDGVIVNSGAIIEHHCHIGSHTHIAPHATLCGEVTVGECTLIGAGASVIPQIKIGDHVTVGAGAVVIGDVIDHLTVVGNPAKQVAMQSR